MSTTVSSLSQLVLPVSFGSSIGSGIVISKHLILTCAHVVQMSSSGNLIQVDYSTYSIVYHVGLHNQNYLVYRNCN